MSVTAKTTSDVDAVESAAVQEAQKPALTPAMFKSNVKPTWCPGCGDFGVLNAVYNAMKDEGTLPENIVCVSGIGCSSRIPFFISTYGLHSTHGRTLPVALGIHLANPELKVLVFSGDGDSFAIGGGHFIHACRRNLDVTLVVMDNEIYGLTKGQTSPTSMFDFVTKTTPFGNIDHPINPVALALIGGATFVARAFSGDPKQMAKIILDGINHKGFSIIDVFSPCPTFNKVDTFDYFREHVHQFPDGRNLASLNEAMQYALDPKMYLGVFYKKEIESFEDQVEKHKKGTPEDTRKVIENLMMKLS